MVRPVRVALPEGEVELKIDAEGYSRAHRTVTMKAGESQTVEALCARGDEFVSLIALDRVLQVDVGN